MTWLILLGAEDVVNLYSPIVGVRPLSFNDAPQRKTGLPSSLITPNEI